MVAAANDKHQRAIKDMQEEKAQLEAKVKELESKVGQGHMKKYEIPFRWTSFKAHWMGLFPFIIEQWL